MRRPFVVSLLSLGLWLTSTSARADVCDGGDPTCDAGTSPPLTTNDGSTTIPPVGGGAAADAYDPGFGTTERSGDNPSAPLPSLPPDDPGCAITGTTSMPLVGLPVGVALLFALRRRQPAKEPRARKRS